MGIFNEHSSSSSYTIGSGSRGERGSPGLGFVMKGGNYSLENRKLVDEKQGTDPNDVVTKSQVDSEIAKISTTTQFVKKSGDTITGPLIVAKDTYPVQGDLNKVVNYETIREIFFSRKEAFPMETAINMNNNSIQNVKDPVNSEHRANKKYVDDQISTKADLTKTTTQIFQSRAQVPDFKQSAHSVSDVVNLKYINSIFLSKQTGGTMKNSITFLSSLPNN